MKVLKVITINTDQILKIKSDKYLFVSEYTKIDINKGCFHISQFDKQKYNLINTFDGYSSSSYIGSTDTFLFFYNQSEQKIYIYDYINFNVKKILEDNFSYRIENICTDDNYFIILKNTSYKLTGLVAYNFLKNDIKWQIEFDLKSNDNINYKEILTFTNYISNLSQLNSLYSFNLETGKQEWVFDVSAYYSNKTQDFQNGIGKLDYLEMDNLLIIRLDPYYIIAVNSENGTLEWKAQTPMAMPNYVLDQEVGMIYILSTVWDTQKNRRTILYIILNGATGETILSYDMYEELGFNRDYALEIN